jgi:isopenicillin N synthase-like dioxygenase
VLDKHHPLLSSFITTSHTLTHLVLRIINSRLQLPPNTLQNLHRLRASSGDQVRFVKAPPQPPLDRKTALGAHTDFGSVTVLFNRVGGLMVRLPKGFSPVPPTSSEGEPGSFAGAEDGEEWVYVNPLPGHCIINLGDALVKFSAGLLRSNIHRVVSPPGAQAATTRYSLVYFSRPEDEVLLGPLVESPIVKERVEAERRKGVVEERVLNSKEWIYKRAMGRRGVGRFEDSNGTEGVRA